MGDFRYTENQTNTSALFIIKDSGFELETTDAANERPKLVHLEHCVAT